MQITPQVKTLYRQGCSLREIAKALQVSTHTVRRILLDNKVKMRPVGRPKIV